VVNGPHDGGASHEKQGLVAVQPSDDAVWLDLTLLNRTELNQVLEHYDVPPEVATYFLLRYQSPKVIHAGSALFVVIWLAAPSLQRLFTLRELKICVAPTLIATMCEPSARAKPQRARVLSTPPPMRAGGVGRLFSDFLEGVLTSYEAVMKTISDQSPTRMEKEEQRLWRQRVEKFTEVLHDARMVVGQVTRTERKLVLADDPKHFNALTTRLEDLLQTVESILRRPHAGAGRWY
jgi:Mg2+ and Co2+ transporter CorA